MDNMYIEKLRKEVKRALKTDKMRFRHTIELDTAACLETKIWHRYAESLYKWIITHDCAKCVPDEKKNCKCRQMT